MTRLPLLWHSWRRLLPLNAEALLVQSALVGEFPSIQTPGCCTAFVGAGAIPAFGANSVEIYGGKRAKNGDCSMENGLRSLNDAGPARVFETFTAAFQPDSIEWQADLLAGYP